MIAGAASEPGAGAASGRAANARAVSVASTAGAHERAWRARRASAAVTRGRWPMPTKATQQFVISVIICPWRK